MALSIKLIVIIELIFKQVRSNHNLAAIKTDKIIAQQRLQDCGFEWIRFLLLINANV